MSKADLDKKPAQVAAMFDEVSTHYDRTNTVLSVGNASLWRVATTRAVGPRAGETILDVAAGTGTSSASLARNGASVVAADFSDGMIEVGRRRQADNPYVTFVQADATQLPFDDDAFDAVTISFGLRNIVDPRAALAEFYRVTKPGGRVVICEFSHPPVALIRAGYSAYLKYGMPVLAKLASSNPAAYEYLMDSIQAWPAQPELAAWLRAAGYESVAWRNLTAGIVALHRGRKPAAPVAAKKSAPAAAEKPAPAAAEKPAPAAAEKPASTAAAKKPATTSSAAKKPATSPAAKKPATATGVAKKPATTSSAAKKPATSPAAKKPATSPAAKKPATSAKPAVAAKPANPAKPAATKPVAKKPTTAKPTTAKPTTAKPATAKPAPAKPAAGGTSSTPSIPPEGE